MHSDNASNSAAIFALYDAQLILYTAMCAMGSVPEFYIVSSARCYLAKQLDAMTQEVSYAKPN